MTAHKEPTVFVVGNSVAYIHMFSRLKYKLTMMPAQADIVCFTGGADVSPELYLEKPINGVHSDAERDTAEMDIFDKTPKALHVGICRGGQLLNVLSGGTMWQHVNNHTYPHGIVAKGYLKNIHVSSTHHQMMVPSEAGEVLAWTDISTLRMAEKKNEIGHNKDGDVEVVWYGHTRSLCFQPHPEYGAYPECTKYFDGLIGRYL